MTDTKHITRQRDPRIDFAKGILIVLVVLGHCIQISYAGSDEFYSNWLFKLIYSFHMPAFMLISGWLFYSSHDKTFRQIAVSKLQQIGIPFLAFCGVCYCLTTFGSYIITGDGTSIWGFIGGFKTYVLSSHAMWFLLSVLLNSMILGSLPPRKNSDILLWIIALGMLIIPKNAYLYAECIYMFPYFVGGYLLHMNGKYILVDLKKTHLYLLAMISCIGFFFFNRETYIYTTGVSLWTEHPIHQLLIDTHRFVIGLSMSLVFFWLVSKVPDSVCTKSWFRKLAECGKTSLAIYGFQNILVFIFISRLFTYFDYNGIARFPIVIATTAIVLTLCHWCIAICKKSSILSMLFCGVIVRKTKNQ